MKRARQKRTENSIENFLLFFDKHVIGARFYCFSSTRELHPGSFGRGDRVVGGKEREKRRKTRKTGEGGKGKRKSVITTNHLADERILYFRGTILPAVAKRQLSPLVCSAFLQITRTISKTGRNKKQRERGGGGRGRGGIYIHHERKI